MGWRACLLAFFLALFGGFGGFELDLGGGGAALFIFGFAFELFEEGLFFVGEAGGAETADGGGDFAVGLEFGEEFLGLDGVGCELVGIGELARPVPGAPARGCGGGC